MSSNTIAKIMLSAIALTMFGVGAYTLINGYTPARNTRFGTAGLLVEKDALVFGITMIILGLTPLLAFIKNRTVSIVAGSILCVVLLCTIFAGIYM